ncbi:baculoviral IAP repeat-containing protein 7-B-like [Dreissena polymorpha]|uniref:baculoviral IAP repeat-containing protein 7-B-like n=1 Tax=Dreissena polymorpha TaxID=45954 RepID=UPI00226434D5|nr:baculoviral IAP repeat-containing protein 7-B-like [Dreissena polymorpha]XP_052243953.1 baculoviral IAP repeat-containing protein 7-B-like [Dreissena polymorpha]
MDVSLRQDASDEPNLPQPARVHEINSEAHRLGIHTMRPLHMDQAILQNRVKSFQRSPDNIRHRALELATAGFFYIGDADCVRCFFCGILLRRWEPPMMKLGKNMSNGTLAVHLCS